MNSTAKRENLIDLISEWNMSLRLACAERWNEVHPVTMSESEWSVLRYAYQQQFTVSDTARALRVSRQAVHKCVRSLQEKRLIETAVKADNRRAKCITLTPLGNQYIQEYMELKSRVEQDIRQSIGTQEFENLKQVLHSNIVYR